VCISEIVGVRATSLNSVRVCVLLCRYPVPRLLAITRPCADMAQSGRPEGLEGHKRPFNPESSNLVEDCQPFGLVGAVGI